MTTALAQQADVTALWPSASTLDPGRLDALIAKASARLRQKLPWVDARIAAFNTDPTDPAGLDPTLVADVVATSIKRYLANPDGATNTSEGSGPYSVSKGYALRGDKDIRGELYIGEEDLASLRPAKKSPFAKTIRTRARLAPWPFGDVGNPALANGGSMDSWLLEEGLTDPAYEFGPFINYADGE